MELLLYISLSFIASLTDAEPIRGCSGAKGNYFVGDGQDPCVYYWCEDGNFLQWVFPCSRGSAVPYGYFGQIVPCIDNRRGCQGGAPRAALIRDPQFGKVHMHTTSPSPTQAAQDDDTPTLSHRPKHVPTQGPQQQAGARHGQRAHNWEAGDMGKHDTDTMQPTWKGGPMEHKKGPNDAGFGGSTTPGVRPTPYQATRTASTTPGTTRQLPSTPGGPLFSSVLPDTSSTPGGGNKQAGGRGQGESSTPDVQTEDSKILPSSNVKDSSIEGIGQLVRRSTAVPMSEMDNHHPDMTGKGDSRGRPDKDGVRYEVTARPAGGTMSSTGQPTASTHGVVRPTDGFMKVSRSTDTPPTTTTATPTTTSTPTTTTTPTSPPTTIPTTTARTTRRTTTTTTTTSTLMPTRRTTSSTTTTPTTTTAPPTPIPDDEDTFDFFGFETQGGPAVDVESLPRVIDHREEEGKEGVTPTEKTTTPKVTTRGLPEFLRTSAPAFSETARTQPPLPTTSPTTTTSVPTTTTIPTTTTQRPTTTATTTERATTTPAPTADPCDEKLPMRGGGQVITKVFPQQHIVGGERRANFTFQIGVIHVTLEIKMASMCYLACDLHPGCAGFDWDIEDGSCWFHTQGSECSSALSFMGRAIAHYRLQACGGVSDSESLKSGGTPAGGYGRGAPIDEENAVDQFVSQLTSGSEPAGLVKPVPDNLQADEMAGQQDGAQTDPGRRDDFESGRPRRVFNMIIDHRRSNITEETESEWEHGS